MILRRLTVGFLPLLDCAPLVVAVERGFAAAEGLDLVLSRESSWANIRDRVAVGQFDAAHMLGPLPVAATLGIGQLKVPMVVPMALGLGGNAITVSTSLWTGMQSQGARPGADPATLGRALREVIRERTLDGAAPLTFAMVYPFSCHHYELRYWLAACGIDPDVDVELVVIPPPLMVDALRSGQIDGFCAGEPWNTLTVMRGVGRIVLPTTAIWRLSPEKVLGLRADWAASHPEETAALVRAVFRAAQWCDEPASHAELALLLARPHYVGEAIDALTPGITGRLRQSADGAPLDIPDFLVFARHAATFPWISHAEWFCGQMLRWGQITRATVAGAAAAEAASDGAAARATYRPDLYRAALQPLGLKLPSADTKSEASAFFDCP